MRASLFVLLCLLLASCGGGSDAVEDFNARDVTLPDGTTVKAEVMMNKLDMAKGMMFRESFPEGRGMLFIHATPGRFSYYMFQVKIPIDIVWMDKQKRIVEIVEKAPPCTAAKATDCPVFGGSEESMYVLELPSGYANKHGVVKGEFLRF
jgi:uncharacterized membrane protein (UPF0127 family)